MKLFLVALILFSNCVFAQTLNEDGVLDKNLILAQAFDEFKIENNLYVDALRRAQEELIFLRNYKLNEESKLYIEKIESQLIESNIEVLSLVEKMELNSQNIFLDDVLLMRMAQLNLEKSDFDFAQKMETNANLESQNADYSKSLHYARRLLKTFPKSPLADRAEYLIAYIFEEQGRFQEAMQVYNFFVKNYPYSSLWDEALWRLAELQFESEQYAEARNNYLKLSKKQDSRFELLALYKLGTSLYEQNELDKSAKIFIRLYKRLSETKTYISTYQSLYDESLEYLGLLISKNVKTNIPKDLKSLALEKLAALLDRNNFYEKSRNVFKQYVESDPNSRYVPQFYAKWIESLLLDGKAEKAQVLRQEFLSKYSMSSLWYQSNQSDYQSIFAANDNYEKFYLDSARYNYELYKSNTQVNKDYLKTASNNYQAFLNQYSYSSRTAWAAYELGQIFYDQKNYVNANKYFQIALEKSKETELTQDAAYAEFLTKLHMHGVIESNNLIKHPKKLSESNFEEETNSKLLDLHRSYESYDKISLESDDKAKIRFNMAQFYYENSYFSKAHLLLQQNYESKDIDVNIKAKSLGFSADIFNHIGDLVSYQSMNEKYIALSKQYFSKVKFDAAKGPNYRLYVQASNLYNTNYKEASAKTFEQIAVVAETPEEANETKFRAAQVYHELGQWQKSAEVLKTTKNYEPADLLLSEIYFSQLNLAAGESLLLKLAKKTKDQKKLQNIYFKLFNNFFDTEDYAKAAIYAESFSNLRLDDNYKFIAAELYIKSNNLEKAKKLLLNFALKKSSNSSSSRIRIAVLEATILKEQYRLSNKLNSQNLVQVSKKCDAANKIYKSNPKVEAGALQSIAWCATHELERFIISGNSKSEDLAILSSNLLKLSDNKKLLEDYNKFSTMSNNFAEASTITDEWQSFLQDLKLRALQYAKEKPLNKNTQDFFNNIKADIAYFDNPLLYFNWTNIESELLKLKYGDKEISNLLSSCDSKDYSQCAKSASSWQSKLILNKLAANEKELKSLLSTEISDEFVSDAKVFSKLFQINTEEQNPLSAEDLLLQNQSIQSVFEFYEAKETKQKISILKSIIEQHPFNAWAFIQLAKIYIENDKYALANWTLQKASFSTKQMMPNLLYLHAIGFDVDKLANKYSLVQDDIFGNYAYEYLKIFAPNSISKLEFNNKQISLSYFSELQYLSYVYEKADKSESFDAKSDNAYMLYLSALSSLKNSDLEAFTSTYKLAQKLGWQSPSDTFVLKFVKNREVAGEK